MSRLSPANRQGLQGQPIQVEEPMTPDEGRQNNTENGMDETPEECDHFAHQIDTDWTSWRYCPQCGEKLKEND